jgi:ubiquinone biosynthesis protein Coq4
MFLKKIHPKDAQIAASAIIGACRLDGWTHELQPQLLHILFKNLLDFECDFKTFPGSSAQAIGDVFQDHESRSEIIDLMLMVEALCADIPEEVISSVSKYADYLGVSNERINMLRDLAKHSIAKAQEDFYRNNYFSDRDLAIENFHALVKSHGLPAYIIGVEDDPLEVMRWEALFHLPEESFGKHLWNFYKKRGFVFPGTAGGVNSAVAHHDWIHVLVDYDSDGIGEIEVAAFSAMATNSDSPVMNFLGVLSIFQGGLLKSLVASANPHLGHDLEVSNGMERVINALQRGRECNMDLILGMNFFEHASRPLETLRREWNIVPKTLEFSEKA